MGNELWQESATTLARTAPGPVADDAIEVLREVAEKANSYMRAFAAQRLNELKPGE